MNQEPPRVRIEFKSPFEQEEEERKKRSIAERKRNWNWDGQFLCKVCKHVHPFALYGDDSRSRSEFFTFSEDFSTVRVPCIGKISETGPLYNYEEMIMPRTSDLDELKARIARLERILGGADLGKDERTVWQRLGTLEKFSAEVAKQLFGETPKSPKEEPKAKEPGNGKVYT
jgi:hypothetical protein